MSRKQWGAALVAVLLVAIAAFGVGVSKRKQIRILDKTKEYILTTTAEDMETVFGLAGITLHPSDKVLPGMETPLHDQMDIQIVRAELVTIQDGEETLQVDTTLTRVSDILRKADIEVSGSDLVYPSDEQVIGADRLIEIVRVREEMETVDLPLDIPVVMRSTKELEPGETVTESEGAVGTKRIVYKNVYENGELIQQVPVSEEVVAAPVPTVMKRGQEKLFVTSHGQPIRYKAVHIMSATAYDLSYASCGKYPDHPEYGITFSGTHARPGVVAVDPRVIKLRSNLYVESLDGWPDYGFSKAEDTGSAIKGNKIDLFMHSGSLAWRFGRRKVRVYELVDPITEDMMDGFSDL